jgi:hypothetical protein
MSDDNSPEASEASEFSETMDTNEQIQKLDDGDFSVAPSLATAMRSVVLTSFDQIYERGKKVGPIMVVQCSTTDRNSIASSHLDSFLVPCLLPSFSYSLDTEPLPKSL